MSMKRGHGVDTAEGLDAWGGQFRQEPSAGPAQTPQRNSGLSRG